MTLPRGAFPSESLRSFAVTAVLFTCAGQRVDIVSAFGRAGATTIAADVNRLAPALYHADRYELVVRVDDPGYVPQLAQLVEEHGVDLVVPLTDLDQLMLARRATSSARRSFCRPPRSPSRWATSTSRTRPSSGSASRRPPSWLPDALPDDLPFPVLVKAREGFGSRHIYRATTARSSTSTSRARRSRPSSRPGAWARSSRSTSSPTSRAAA